MDQPGLLFVAATLLPLASFLLLLLLGALRCAVRRTRHTSALSESVYRFLGGDTPGRGGAYVATGAIALAFVLCAVGAVLFFQDKGHIEALEQEVQALRHPDREDVIGGVPREALDPAEQKKLLKEKTEELERAEAASHKKWNERWNWLAVGTQYVSRTPDSQHPAPARVLQLGFHIDHLSVVMFLMVTFIASLIHLFSIGYMGDELKPEVEDHQVHTEHGHLHRRGRFGRFFLFLSLFCFSMLNLILADNLFQVFLSWELVGVCSYLLIGFYFERQSAANAANKAFITNRVGDAGFIIGLLILWSYLGTFNFNDLFTQVRSPLRDAHGPLKALGGQVVRGDVAAVDAARGTRTINVTDGHTGSELILFPLHQELEHKEGAEAPHHFHGVYPATDDQPSTKTVHASPDAEQYGSMPYWLLVVAGLGIFLGCVGKSAQFPLHVWLPDAMEGPTPVSALIHAATMVAAGVYLVGRVFPLFTDEARLVIAYTGGITLFMAATIAVVMTDIKKVLAYSTVSQLGYMMLALGVGGWVAGLFHLITHAFFKALLFLCSGSVIYGCHHEQEMTKMGGLWAKMRITAITMGIGVLTIAGIPLFSGWYSKDAIIAQSFGFVLEHPHHVLLFLLPLVTAGITAFYMARMWFLTFTGQPRDEHVYEHAHESPWTMTVPLIVLAVFSLGVGWGWPLFSAEAFPYIDPHASALEYQLHHAQHAAVYADFGIVSGTDPFWEGGKPLSEARVLAHEYAHQAGNFALGVVALGLLFSALVYYYRKLDAEDARSQFPAVHRFLWHKWYFDELYSALVVRPALVVARWCRLVDTKAIDGTVDTTAAVTVKVAKWDGLFDLNIIDGIVNLLARVTQTVGDWLRGVQTGYLRSYVLFLVLAAVGIFIVMSYVMMAPAAP
jgi:NADH-quinone oxidoreductase subunit L